MHPKVHFFVRHSKLEKCMSDMTWIYSASIRISILFSEAQPLYLAHEGGMNGDENIPVPFCSRDISRARAWMGCSGEKGAAAGDAQVASSPQKPARAKHVLREGWSCNDINGAAREMCRNWFYKTACIRELLPRILVEVLAQRVWCRSDSLSGENFALIESWMGRSVERCL